MMKITGLSQQRRETPPMNLSSIDRWETPHTSTDNETTYSEANPRRFYGIHRRTGHFIRLGNPEGSCYNNASHLHRHPQSRKEGTA